MQSFQKQEDDAVLYLVGFRINPDIEKPEVYTLLLCNDVDKPLITEDGYIVFFTKPEAASMALELGTDDFKKYAPAPNQVELVCDIAKMMFLISEKNCDPDATIINCLNTLSDLVATSDLEMPEEYRKLLFVDFAGVLTFNREYGNFFDQNGSLRTKVLDAVLWCIGLITIKAKMFFL